MKKVGWKWIGTKAWMEMLKRLHFHFRTEGESQRLTAKFTHRRSISWFGEIKKSGTRTWSKEENQSTTECIFPLSNPILDVWFPVVNDSSNPESKGNVFAMGPVRGFWSCHLGQSPPTNFTGTRTHILCLGANRNASFYLVERTGS